VNDSNEIDDEELLYRKVSVNSGWYNLDRNELKLEAVKPFKHDDNGISLDRAKSRIHPEFRSIVQAAQGPSKNGYYIATFRVGDLSSNGLTVIPDPLEGNPGHALIVDLTYVNRKDPASFQKMLQLVHKLVIRVEGPF